MKSPWSWIIVLGVLLVVNFFMLYRFNLYLVKIENRLEFVYKDFVKHMKQYSEDQNAMILYDHPSSNSSQRPIHKMLGKIRNIEKAINNPRTNAGKSGEINRMKKDITELQFEVGNIRRKVGYY